MLTTLPRAPRRLLVLVLIAAAAPSAAAVPSDSTDALAWARRVVALRAQLADARRAADAGESAAPALADRAFREARSLAEDPRTRDEERFRALFLEAQETFERFHGGVPAIALSASEVADLRDDELEALATGGSLPEVPSSPTGVAAAAPTRLSALAYPDDAAPSIAAQAGRLRHMLGDVRGLERRGRGYFRMIDRELARRGMPRELRYVPVIESGLNPRAVSPAGAAGLWQLMPATGAQFGLDAAGRHDPARSTVAAVRLLERLGRMFEGDWQLALAAYNWGPARVQSLVRRERRRLGRKPTFWDVARHMPAETRAYVPRFIAVAEAMEG